MAHIKIENLKYQYPFAEKLAQTASRVRFVQVNSLG